MDSDSIENANSDFGISIEVVDAEPLSEAEMEHLADLFADEIIEKWLKKVSKHGGTDTTGNG